MTAWQQHDDPVYENERRAAYHRDDDDDPRADPQIRFRTIAASLLTLCLGLAILYLAFVLIGAADFGDSLGFTIAAVVLAGLWALGAWQRSRKGAYWVTRNERERRGF